MKTFTFASFAALSLTQVEAAKLSATFMDAEAKLMQLEKHATPTNMDNILQSISSLQKAVQYHQKEEKFLTGVEENLNGFWHEADQSKQFVFMDDQQATQSKSKAESKTKDKDQKSKTTSGGSKPPAEANFLQLSDTPQFMYDQQDEQENNLSKSKEEGKEKGKQAAKAKDESKQTKKDTNEQVQQKAAVKSTEKSTAGGKETLESATSMTEQTQLKTLLGFKQMEDQMAKLEQQTKELQKAKELEALKLKEQAALEAQMKTQLEATTKMAISARKYESQMINLRNQATSKIFDEAKSDIEKKVQKVDEYVQKSNQLAKEITQKTSSMQAQLNVLQGQKVQAKEKTAAKTAAKATAKTAAKVPAKAGAKKTPQQSSKTLTKLSDQKEKSQDN